jgi:hypothetical protein
MTNQLAAQVAAHRYWLTGTVTKASRSGFHATVGASDGVKRGLEAEVLRRGPSGTVVVARAKVHEVDESSSRLRRTDRVRNLRVKRNDTARIDLDKRIMLGAVGGVATGAAELLRSNLIHSLRDDHGLDVREASQVTRGTPESWSEAPDLRAMATTEGCTHALAGWGEAAEDKLHLALALIEISSGDVVEFYSGSADIDPALAAMLRGEAATSGTVGGTGAHGPATGSGSGLDLSGGPSPPQTSPPYQTGLEKKLEAGTEGIVLGMQVLMDKEYLCFVYSDSVQVFQIGPGGPGLKKDAVYEIDAPPARVPCRDAMATVSSLDSNGDGSKELVLWSSRLDGPVSFTVIGSRGGDPTTLERAEQYWLPWADPLGDGRFEPGKNMMTARATGDTPYLSWKTADVTGDGTPEVILAGIDGSVTVRDTSMTIIARLQGAGPAVEAYDMNGDGLPELMVSTYRNPEGGGVEFYNWSGEGFQKTWEYSGLSGGVLALAAGMIDEDHYPDLMVLTRKSLRAERSSIHFILSGTEGRR